TDHRTASPPRTGQAARWRFAESGHKPNEESVRRLRLKARFDSLDESPPNRKEQGHSDARPRYVQSWQPGHTASACLPNRMCSHRKISPLCRERIAHRQKVSWTLYEWRGPAIESPWAQSLPTE